MSDDDYRGLSRDKLVLKCRILEIRKRTASQETEQIIDLVLQDPAAGEADARALPAPVAGRSAQLVRAPQEAPAPPGPSVRRSAAGSDDIPNAPVYRRRGGEHQGSMPVRDRRPAMERSVHTRTRANRDRATCTPIDLGGNNRRNAARAGAGYAGTNPRRRASAQPEAQVPAPLDPGNRFDSTQNRNPRSLLLREAGVNPSMAMTPEDLDLAKNTPLITGRSFNALFGGDSRHERPMSNERNILCLNRKVQPYAPHSPGKSGLVFIISDIALLEDVCEIFHLFLNKDPRLSRSERQIRYLGTYTKVPIVHATVEPNEWLSLPKECSDALFHRFECSNAYKEFARTRADSKAAIISGEKKIKFEVIKYVGYDHDIATRLQTTLLQGDLA